MKAFSSLLSLSLLLIVILLSLTLGSSSIGPSDIWRAFMGQQNDVTAVLYLVRLPHVSFSILIGATLGLSGAIFQTLFRNPLADPYILGVSGGAALGATLSIAIWGTLPWIGAGIGSFIVIILIAGIAGWTRGRTSTYVVLLAGVMINSFCGALILGMRSVISAQKSQEILFYLVGTLSSVEMLSTTDLILTAISTLLALLLSIFYSKELDLILLGDEEAKALGANPNKLRIVLIIGCSVAVAVAVSFTGLIGFVGLVAPHAVRIWIGPRHRALLPLSALTGAIFLTFSDVVARTSFHFFQTTIPVGAVTAIIGAPLFLLFLRRYLREAHA